MRLRSTRLFLIAWMILISSTDLVRAQAEFGTADVQFIRKVIERQIGGFEPLGGPPPENAYNIAGNQVASGGKAAMMTMPIRNRPTNGQVAANTSLSGTSRAAPLKAKMV